MIFPKLFLAGFNSNQQVVFFWRDRTIVNIRNIGTIRIISLVKVNQIIFAFQFRHRHIYVAAILITIMVTGKIREWNKQMIRVFFSLHHLLRLINLQFAYCIMNGEFQYRISTVIRSGGTRSFNLKPGCLGNLFHFGFDTVNFINRIKADVFSVGFFYGFMRFNLIGLKTFQAVLVRLFLSSNMQR